MGEDKDFLPDLAEKDGVVTMRLQGMFYEAYSDSAKVLSVITGFKIKQKTANSQLKCGFPSSSLGKIEGLLREHDICYMVSTPHNITCYLSSNHASYDAALKMFSDASVIRPYLNEGNETEVPKSDTEAIDKVSVPEEKKSFLSRIFGQFFKDSSLGT